MKVADLERERDPTAQSQSAYDPVVKYNCVFIKLIAIEYLIIIWCKNTLLIRI